MLREAFQDLNRVRQIVGIAARHGFGAYLDQSGLGELLGSHGAEEVRREVAAAEPAGPAPDRRTAQRFRRLLVDLGPTFIKLGQLLSSRPDMLPSHWIEELSELQDAVPPFPIAQVRREIEQGLGRPVEACFAHLDEEPLASASIAQVHLAQTHDGERVVVKVRRPGIRQRVEADVGLLYQLARLVEAVVEETGVYTPTDIVEEFDRAIHEELDLSNEARNAREMRTAAQRRKREFLVIPRVFDELSSDSVLTLEYVEGAKVSEIRADQGYDFEQVARNIIEGSFRQLFEDGLFHGDPHPGNLLVLPDNRVALIDFGLVGRLTRPMQEALVTLIMATALRDADTMARVLNRIGVPEEHTPITAFRNDIDAIFDRYLGLKLDEIRTSTLLRDLLDLAVKHKIRVPKEYAVLSKASITVEGVIRRLYPKLDVLEIGLPYAKELLFARFSPGEASGTLMKSLLKLQALAEDVPAQLQQVLVDLESGKFRVNVRSAELDRIAGNVRVLGLYVLLGMLASALTVGGLVVLSRNFPTWSGLPYVGAAALAFAGALFGAGVVMYLAGGIPRRKIKLRRLLTRSEGKPKT